MRNIFVALVLSVSTIVAAQQKSDVQAPVNVAFRLYSDCMKSKVETTRDIEPTRVGIHAFVEQADENCLAWMLIWYPPLMNGERFEENEENVKRFNARRLPALQGLLNHLREQAMIR